MFWLRFIFILSIALFLMFLIIKTLKNKEFVIFLITYIVSVLIRLFVRVFVGISFNLFNNFDLILFITDIVIWVISYFVARLIVTKSTK